MNEPKVLYLSHDACAGSAMSLFNMISSLKGKINPVVVCSEKGRLVDMLTSAGIRCNIYPFMVLNTNFDTKYYITHFPKLLIWYYKNIRQNVNDLYDRYKEEKIDIVHSNNSNYIIGYLLAKKLGAKHVWHVREFLTLDHGIRVFGGMRLLRHIIHRSDAIVAISSPVYEFWKLKKNNSYLIGNAVVKLPKFKIITDKEKYILFCSAYLNSRKGPLFAIEAFSKSSLKHKGYKLRIIGKASDTMRETIRRKINECGIANDVELLDYSDNLGTHYANATAYLMASENEALGRVTIEAMYYGCPVIGRNSGGTKDIIDDKVTGYLFDNLDQCADLLDKIIETDNTDLIRRAQDKVIDCYSEESFRDKMLGVYSDLLK